MPDLLRKNINVPTEFIAQKNGVSLYLKREDLLHPDVSGNKFRKLKYNIDAALRQKKDSVLTFGGAFSNHIAATAAAGKLYNLRTIGIIRGEELGGNIKKTLQENPTLRFAASCGMQLEFITRNDYRKKTSEELLGRLQQKFGDFFFVPEGGTNAYAVKGCEEILDEEEKKFDIVCCAVGTGGTLSGLINASSDRQRIIGFPALKGGFLIPEIERWVHKNNWELAIDYHFGGYAKVNSDLIEFINNFKSQYDIPLDPVYTGKMMYGIFDLMEKKAFPENTRILAVHTGGLQGIAGMNDILKKKNLPQIRV